MHLPEEKPLFDDQQWGTFFLDVKFPDTNLGRVIAAPGAAYRHAGSCQLGDAFVAKGECGLL